MGSKRRLRILAAGVLVVVVLFGAVYVAISMGLLPTPGFMGPQPAPLPAPAATRDGRWQQAVEYLGSQLPALHVDPFFKLSQADFEQRVSQLTARVPEMNDEQIVVEMLRIIAALGDGHTRAFPEAPPLNYPSLPLKMWWLEEGLFVVAASPEYAQALGARVVQVGGRPLEAVYAAVKPLVAADNEIELLSSTPAYLAMPAVLYGLDLTPHREAVSMDFEAQDGSRFSLTLRPAADEAEPLVSIYEQAGVPQPLYEQDRQSYYWYRHLPESNAVYVQYNVCGNQQGKPFKDFVEEVFDLIDRHPGARLVLDVRYNGGGNESVLAPFIAAVKARPELNTAGKLFVIIGRGTYSSALQNALTLRRETAAILVGEATGGKPNHYGEVRSFRLPNVGLRVQYSTRYWLNDPGNDAPTLVPDVPVALTMADLLSGRDPALEAALR